jgi:hypothetical protein
MASISKYESEQIEQANAESEVFAHKSVGQVADHFGEVADKALEFVKRFA